MGNRTSSGGGGSVVVSLFLIMLFLGGVGVAWYFAWQGGLVGAPSEIRDDWLATKEKNKQLEQENEELSEENSDLKRNEQGVSNWMLWGMLIVFLILALMAWLSSTGGGNITLRQAIKIARAWVKEWYGIRAYLDGTDSARSPYKTYKRITPFVGQKEAGDGDAVWYIIEFGFDTPYSVSPPPDAWAMCVIMKSNNHQRQLIVEFGMNAQTAAKRHKIEIQKAPMPTSLAKELQEARAEASVAETMDALRKE